MSYTPWQAILDAINALGGTGTGYAFDRKAGGAAKTTYFGFIKFNDGRWMIKRQVVAVTTGDVTEQYANEGNNGAYTTLDLAWPNRVGLVYEDFIDLTGV